MARQQLTRGSTSVEKGSEVLLSTTSFPPGGGVGLVPKRGCLLTLAYYAFPRWYEFGERRWNDIDRGKWRTRRKICPSATLSTIYPTWIEPGANPGLRGDRPATNYLSHGTAALINLQALLLYLVQRSVEATYYTVNGHCSCRPANIRFFRPGIFKWLKCTGCFHY
jgi:hypothetical protein